MLWEDLLLAFFDRSSVLFYKALKTSETNRQIYLRWERIYK